MCATCGCGVPDEHDHHREHAHDHVHVHGHEHDEVHGHQHEHDRVHDHHHQHDHGHGHQHEHDRVHDHEHGHQHDHDHVHDHEHGHQHDHGHRHEHGVDAPHPDRTITLEHAILAKNDRLAAENRAWLAARGLLAVNLMSSPGAGKTTLLERTIAALGAELPLAVIEGDQATARDAERIRARGARAVQINTGTGCHLDAAMVAGALRALDPAPDGVVFIENVGNLVCPALFALGERRRVVIVAVTEGEDKPLKYPHMFRAAELLVVSKIDLLPHVDVDLERLAANARRVNPALQVLPLSPTRGDGLDGWYAWLRRERAARAAAG